MLVQVTAVSLLYVGLVVVGNVQADCQTDKAQAENLIFQQGHPFPGLFIAQCANDGSYKNPQCNPSTGYCWCVNAKTGQKILGTESRNTVSCPFPFNGVSAGEESSTTATPSTPSSCRHDRDSAIASEDEGAFIARCDKKGYYMRAQCYNATGYCWCVDKKTGVKKAGTEKLISEGPLQCVPSTTPYPAGACQLEVTRKSSSSELDSFVPTCDEDGNYAPKQCDEKSGICWCVNPSSGAALAGLRATIKAELSCGAANTMVQRDDPAGKEKSHDCKTERTTALANTDTIYVPECTANGEYEPVQCNKWGACWCTDRLTGTKIRGSPAGLTRSDNFDCANVSPRPTHQPPQDIPPSDCLMKSKQVGNGKSGVLSCTDDGYYEKIQCDDSTCWCAHKVSGQKYPGTEKSLSFGHPDCSDAEAVAQRTLNTTCLRHRFKAINDAPPLIVGNFIPKCEADGSFKTLQCSGSTGYCWCVDAVTGEEIKGTHVPPGGGRHQPDCSRVTNKVSGGDNENVEYENENPNIADVEGLI